LNCDPSLDTSCRQIAKLYDIREPSVNRFDTLQDVKPVHRRFTVEASAKTVSPPPFFPKLSSIGHRFIPSWSIIGMFDQHSNRSSTGMRSVIGRCFGLPDEGKNAARCGEPLNETNSLEPVVWTLLKTRAPLVGKNKSVLTSGLEP
jgi:hypothetical protein